MGRLFLLDGLFSTCIFLAASWAAFCGANSTCYDMPGPPMIFEFTDTSVGVEWHCPCCVNACCSSNTVNYTVIERRGTSIKKLGPFSFPAGSVHEDLQPFQNYQISVLMEFPNGTVYQTPESSYKTGTASPPKDLVVLGGLHAIKVTWSQLEDDAPEGTFKGYTVDVEEYEINGSVFPLDQHSTIVESNVFHAAFTTLNQDRFYIIRVAVFTETSLGMYGTTNVSLDSADINPLVLFYDPSFGLKYVLSPSSEDLLPTFSSTVSGMAVDWRNSQLFIGWSSGSTGQIRVYQLRVATAGAVQMNAIPLKIISAQLDVGPIDVDWMNRRLYWAQQTNSVDEFEIVRWDIDGKSDGSPFTVITGITKRPRDIVVDPLMGLIYWSTVDGIYRASLLSGANLTKIVSDSLITLLSLDYRNNSNLYYLRKGLIYTSSGRASVYAHVIDFNVVGNVISCFHNVSNQIVFKSAVLTSDISVGDQLVSFQTDYFAEAQPLPLTVHNLSQSFQVLFSSNKAYVSFAPVKIAGGAENWQPSSFLLQWKRIQDQSEFSINFAMVNSSGSDVVSHLTPSSKYRFTLQIYMTASGEVVGKETSFVGTTLPDEDNVPVIVGVSSGDLVLQRLDGSSMTSMNSAVSGPTRDLAVDSVRGQLFVAEMSTVWNFSLVNGQLTPAKGQKLFERQSTIIAIAVDSLGRLFFTQSTESTKVFSYNLDSGEVTDFAVPIANESLTSLSIHYRSGMICVASVAHIACCQLNRISGWSTFAVSFALDLAVFRGVAGSNIDVYSLSESESQLIVQKHSYMNSEQCHSTQALHVNSTVLHRESIVSDLVKEGGTIALAQGKLAWSRKNEPVKILDVSSQSVAQLIGPDVTKIDLFEPNVSDGCSDLNSVVPTDPRGITAEFVLSSVLELHVSWRESSMACSGKIHYEVRVILPEKTEATCLLNLTANTKARILLVDVEPFSPVTMEIKAFSAWATSRPSVQSLRTPGVVTKLRTFYDCNASACDVDLRWDAPVNRNDINYTVTWYKVENMNVNESTNTNEKFARLSGLLPNTPYTFEVLSSIDSIGLDVTGLNRTFPSNDSVTVPLLLVSSGNEIRRVDLDNSERTTALLASAGAEILFTQYGVNDGVVCWVEKTASKHTVYCSSGQRRWKIVSATIMRGLTYDWIARKIYFSWQEFDSVAQTNVVGFSRCAVDRENACERLKKQNSGNIKAVLVDPLQRYFFWIESLGESNRIGKMMVNNLMALTKTKRSCSQDIDDLGPVLALDATQKRLIVSNEQTGDLLSCSPSTLCDCFVLVNATLLLNSDRPRLSDVGLPPSSVIVDDQHIYWITGGRSVFYVSRMSPTVDLLTYQSDGPVSISVDASGQRLDSSIRHCLFPAAVPTSGVLVTNKTSTSISFRWETPSVIPSCQSVVGDIAKPFYVIRYWETTLGLAGAKNLSTEDENVAVRDLKPFTLHSFQLMAENYWNRGMGLFSSIFNETSGEGASSPPGNVTATNFSVPAKIMVTWTEPDSPKGKITAYRILYRSEGSSFQNLTVTNGQFQAILSVQPEVNYFIQVAAVNGAGDGEYSTSVLARSFPEPPPPRVSSNGNVFSLAVDLSTYPQLFQSYGFYFRCQRMDGCVNPLCLSYRNWTLAGTVSSATALPQLLPASQYAITIGLERERYFSSNEVNVSTPAGPPSRVEMIEIIDVKSTSALLSWILPCNNGAVVRQFCYRFRSSDSPTCVSATLTSTSSPDQSHHNYEFLDLSPGQSYVIAISANNSDGIGDWAEASFTTTNETSISDSDNAKTIAVAVSVPVGLLVIILIVLFIIVSSRRKVKAQINSFNYSNGDTQLVNLRATRISHTDLLRNVNPSYLDTTGVEDLTLFPRSQLSLESFLGEGQFGEVYKGVAVGLIPGEEKTNVAVKTLHKDATDNLKQEFLKEARFMGNFRHPNILQLFGVCIDSDPMYMIMELMEGGDLLTFLRGARQDIGPPLLTMSELLRIAQDICAGGKYLEQQRFVHRDLASRNCLVSTRGLDRVIKIGDFGMARNVYRNQYYRKEGEGLLPVRWMAPECLIDGVFTTQGDVWSFGVVLWEVFTFGHQPYPARTNQEVLKFVVQGGRLERPSRCPDDVFRIMYMCWAHAACDRPTFRALLDRLKMLNERVDRKSVLYVEDEDDRSQPGSDSELEEMELQMDLDESEREESARAATGEGQIYLGMVKPINEERYVPRPLNRAGSQKQGRGSTPVAGSSTGENGARASFQRSSGLSASGSRKHRPPSRKESSRRAARAPVERKVSRKSSLKRKKTPESRQQNQQEPLSSSQEALVGKRESKPVDPDFGRHNQSTDTPKESQLI
eukprot:m.14550 g.14550  ORF g.14550 m.14550 type:complete len:2329 (+) comp25813_c0_seq2:64-7050(+)